MYEKELEEIQKGWNLHGRTLIRLGFEEALKLTIAQQPLSGSGETPSPKSAEPTSDNGKRCVKYSR